MRSPQQFDTLAKYSWERVKAWTIQIGRSKSARRAYGIDEIALVPGTRTLDPSLADTSWRIGGH
jgi:IMP dehydrogenase